MLEQLALHHDKWLRMANGICKDPVLAEDLVGDMYVKLSEYDKEVNDPYVYYAIKHLFIDHVRAAKKTAELHAHLQYEGMMYSTEPETQPELHNEIIFPDCLTWVEKQILLLRQTKSGRDIEKQYHINYQKVHRIENRAKEKLTAWVKKSEAQAMSLQQ